MSSRSSRHTKRVDSPPKEELRIPRLAEPEVERVNVGLAFRDARDHCIRLRLTGALNIYGERLLMGTPLALSVLLAAPAKDFTPHKDLVFSKAINLSGGRKRPLRSCGGTTAFMASSLSVGSTWV